MAGYIGSKASVTQVDGYNRTEADSEFVQVTGDTMTGDLSVTGTVKSTVSTTGDFNLQAISTGGGNYRIYPDDATTANPTWLHQSNSSEEQAWVIGGVERMRLDASGRVTINAIPSFHARANYSTATSVVGVLNYSTVEYNVGNHFSTSTDSFTAPVAGLYHFDVSMFFTAITQNSGYAYISLMKNGSLVRPYSHSDSSGTVNYDTLTLSRDLQLAANDYVQVYALTDSTRVYNGDSYNHFSGFLIG